MRRLRKRPTLVRLAGLQVRLNLIDVNDSTGRFQPPTAEELSRFRTWLEPLRHSLGTVLDAYPDVPQFENRQDCGISESSGGQS